MVIFPLCGEDPTLPISTKICMVGSLPEFFTCAKFQFEIFRGYDFTGVEFSIFIDFCMALTRVQRYCAACDFLSLTYKVLTTNQPQYLHNLITAQLYHNTYSSSKVTCSSNEDWQRRRTCHALKRPVTLPHHKWLFSARCVFYTFIHHNGRKEKKQKTEHTDRDRQYPSTQN